MRNMMLSPILGFVLLTLLVMSGSTAVSGSIIAGTASVIDGDTIEIHGQRIRLHGIDAPESSQLCERKNGKRYRCGQVAALALSDKIGRRPVSCAERGLDRYERVIAICYLSGEDLGGWMVRQGHALAYRRYSHEYVDEEELAELDQVGIWLGRFVLPSRWRRGERL